MTLVLALSAALAQDLYVDPNAGPTLPPNTYTTLSAAAQDAANGANLWIEPGDYSAEGVITIGRSMQLIGTAPGVQLPPLSLSPGGIYAVPTVTLRSVELYCPTDILDSAAVYKGDNIGVLLDQVSSDCGDQVDRTLVLAEGRRTLTIRDSTFVGSGNHAIADGSPVLIEGSSFTGSGNSRALLVRDTLGALTPPDVTITGSSFSSFDKTSFNGGAIYVNAATTTLTVSESAFANNAAAAGGALYIRNAPSAVIDSSTFDANGAGAVVLIDSAAAIVYSQFTNTLGDGIHTISSGAQTTEVTGCSFRDNLGRGFVSEAAQSSIVRTSHFCGNAGDVRWVTGDLLLEGSTFALGQEGTDAIDGTNTVAGTLTLRNTTFAGVDGSAVDVSTATGYNVDVRETIFHDLATEAVYGGGTPGLGAGAYNNLYLAPAWAGGGFVAGDFDSYATTVDPQFQGYVDRATTTCDTLNLWIDPVSPLRDLGVGTDLDGTASDIGGYGGPYADLTDGDGDNVFEDRDCDDADATIYPGAIDIAHDGIDQDCDGVDNLDEDGDGYDADFAGGTDCDDTDATINPGAAEIGSDGIDQDCDGYDLTDVDADGFDSVTSGGADCDDLDASVNPDATEVWYDGIDQDCDGADDYDADGDGYASADHTGDDCDDATPEINPGATEIPDNGVDEDCDGSDGTAGTGTGTATGGTGTGDPGGDPKPPKTCSTTGSPSAGWTLVLGLLLLGRRYRSARISAYQTSS